MQKTAASVYSNNKQSENEITRTISFPIASKRIKYVEIDQKGERFLQWKLQNSAESKIREIKKYMEIHFMLMD